MWTFARENINRTLNHIGYIDADGWVTRAALNHPKVRAGAAILGSDDEGEEGAENATTLAAQQVVLHEKNLERARCVKV